MTAAPRPRRSALYLPASNPRAVAPDAKVAARAAAVIAAFADPAAGALRIDGRMVERLHLAEARRIVALAAAA